MQQALTVAPDDIGAALAEFGWSELVATDEAFAFTTLFEEQGYLGADTDALDVVTLAALGITEPAHIVWPLQSVAADDALAADELTVDGIALRSVAGPGQGILVPAGGRLYALDASSLDETPLTGMAHELAWVRVRVRGVRTTGFGVWSEVERRARLAIASEIVGVAATHRRRRGGPRERAPPVRPAHRREPGRAPPPGRGLQRRGGRAGARRARHGKTGPPSAAAWAKAVAGTAQDAAAKHAIQVCGAIGLSEEHELPRLVRRGFALDALLGSAAAVHERLGSEAFSSAPPVAVGGF